MRKLFKINEFIDNKLLVEKFNILSESFDEETLLISSSSDIKNNINYKEIINLGEDVIPFLIEKIKKETNIGYLMLISELSNIQINNNISGNVKKMTEFYINWYESTNN